jgi:hypothetical protein
LFVDDDKLDRRSGARRRGVVECDCQTNLSSVGMAPERLRLNDGRQRDDDDSEVEISDVLNSRMRGRS